MTQFVQQTGDLSSNMHTNSILRGVLKFQLPEYVFVQSYEYSSLLQQPLNKEITQKLLPEQENNSKILSQQGKN